MSIRKKGGRPKLSRQVDITALLDIALKEFANNGFVGTQQKIIAKKAGVANSLINYHFKNKEDLWKRAVMQLLGNYNSRFEEINAALNNIESFNATEKLNFLKSSVRQYIYFCAENPEFDKIFFHEIYAESERADWLMKHVSAPLDKILKQNLTILESTDFILNGLPHANLSAIFVGMCNTFFIQAYQIKKLHGVDPYDPEEVEKHADIIINLLFK